MNIDASRLTICATFSLLLPACSSARSSTAAADADDAGRGGATVTALTLEDAGTLQSITTSPLVLVPAFSPLIHDYYVRCASGSNAVTFTVQSDSGTQTLAESLVEDDLVEIGASYFVRCLPHDFPTVTVTTHPDAGSPTPGWYLAGNDSLVTGVSSFAMVFDTNGTPVWYQRGSLVINVSSPAVNTLALMAAGTAGYGTSSTANFAIETLGGAQTTVAAVGSDTDPHELQPMANGDYLVFTYVITPGVNLTGLATYGANETIADCTIQEITPGGTVAWSWRASDHIDPVTESLEQDVMVLEAGTVVDPFHLNSIDIDATGNLLVSSRHMNSVFYIEKSTGKILWKMGGTTTNKDGAAYLQVLNDPQTTFSEQHDARFQPNGDVSMFDDHGASAGVARGVQYAIDHDAGTATMDWEFLGIEQSQFTGSFRRYPDGESVVGWGYLPPDARILTEVNAAGEDVLDLSLNVGVSSYRSIKVPLEQLDASLLRTTAGK